MAYTTTYSFALVSALDLENTASGIDIVGLADGGLAGVGDTSGHIDATFFDAGLDPTVDSVPLTGLNGAVDQLTGGAVVVVSEASGDVVYRLVTPAGDAIVADRAFFGTQLSNPDVAALAGGGFVITSQRHFDSTQPEFVDNDVQFHLFNAAGDYIDNNFIVPGILDDHDAKVAALADGGFAVAWTRTNYEPEPDVTEAWYAVYEADGTVRKGPTQLDAWGGTNTVGSIVGLPTGGFAIAYEDTGWQTGNSEITLARLDSGGGLLGWDRTTTYAGADTEPSLAVLSNGLLAMTWSTFVGGDRDIYAQLFDPQTGQSLLALPHVVTATLADETDSAATAWGLAGLAVSQANSAYDVRVRQLTRTSVGDGAGDLITGDDAIDLMAGAEGADTLSGLANTDRLEGGDGADLLNGGSGDDTLLGGAGADTADYTGAGAVSVDLGYAFRQDTGAAGFDRLVDVENLIGSAGGDVLTGADAANRLLGGDGADTLNGLGGADTLEGGRGPDSLTGGAADDLVRGGYGPDTLCGGLGVDTLDYAALTGDTFLSLADSSAQNTHSGGADTLIGFENVLTGAGDDRIFGFGADNRIEAGDGADTLKGKDGSDVLLGGAGADRLNGGGGFDIVDGGLGRDFLRGGLYPDLFDFNAVEDSGVGLAQCDVIRDFRSADGDRIDLSDLYAGELYWAGDGTAALGISLAGQVWVEATADGQLVHVDVTGDGVSDTDILVKNGGLASGAADFVL
jgi:hypothetical protein